MIHTAIKTAKTQTIDAKDFFGISRPIIQSTIVGVCNSRLTIAVSNEAVEKYDQKACFSTPQ